MAIAISASAGSTAVGSTSITLAHTPTDAGINLFFMSHRNVGCTNVSAVFNSTAMTLIAASTVTNNAVRAWYHISPTTAAINIVSTWSNASSNGACYAITLTGVNSSTPITSTGSSGADSSVLSATVGTSVGDWAFVCLGVGNQVAPSTGAGEALAYYGTCSAGLGVYYEIADAVSESLPTGDHPTTNYNKIWFSLNPSSAAAAAQPPGGISWWY